MAAAAAAAPPQAEVLETGKFYFEDGTTYEGQYKVLGLPPPVPAEPAKKGAKKKDEEPAAAPAEPPKPVRHGKGKLESGSYTYEGDWKDDEMHGEGRFTYASGAVYEGQWVSNRYHGTGRYTFPDGKVYEGEWVENKMHGSGTITTTDKHKWSGQFYNGAGPGLTCHV